MREMIAALGTGPFGAAALSMALSLSPSCWASCIAVNFCCAIAWRSFSRIRAQPIASLVETRPNGRVSSATRLAIALRNTTPPRSGSAATSNPSA
jgi:hypothetical protein